MNNIKRFLQSPNCEMLIMMIGATIVAIAFHAWLGGH